MRKNTKKKERIAQQLKELIGISQDLLSDTDTKAIFSKILERGLAITGAEYGTINLFDDSNETIEIVEHRGLKNEWSEKKRVQHFSEGTLGYVASTGNVVRIDDLIDDEKPHPLKTIHLQAFEQKTRSELAVPILQDGEIKGAINLESTFPYKFGEDDESIIKSLAEYCVIALKTAKEIEREKVINIGFVTGDISHKMNSPLGLIKKNAEIIEMKFPDLLNRNSELAEEIAEIKRKANTALEMVERKVREAKQALFDIEATSVVQALSNAIAESDVPPNINIINLLAAEDNLPDVKANRHLSSIVFCELIKNAIKAMDHGGNITVGLESVTEPWMFIYVEDTGRGIPENRREAILNAISSSGSGFGLPFAKTYLENLGGKLVAPVQGAKGSGAKFVIQLRVYNKLTDRSPLGT